MNHEELITQKELMDWAEAYTKPALAKWLTECEIPFHTNAKKRIVSTRGAVNSFLYGTNKATPDSFIQTV